MGEHITFAFTRTYKQHRFETSSIPIYTHTRIIIVQYIYIHSKSVLHTIYSHYLTTALISVFRVYLYKHIIDILYMRGGS